ncbi:MAG: hypothetical protein HY909_03345 [Deltaproteobacteria bacterium]|nr:hypothetical protein [Deltaproteobacteria bacterium]
MTAARGADEALAFTRPARVYRRSARCRAAVGRRGRGGACVTTIVLGGAAAR